MIRRIQSNIASRSNRESTLVPNLPLPPAKVLPFKRTASSIAQKKAASAADGLDGPQSVRKWDRRTLVTLLLLTALIAGAVVGLSKWMPKSTHAPTTVVARHQGS
jgi:hypothetical protein